MLNECLLKMYDVSAVPDRCLHLCMINVHVCMFKHSVLCNFYHVCVHGALSPLWLKIGSRPLRWSEAWGRDSMVSVLMLQHGPAWSLKDCSDRGIISSTQQQAVEDCINSKILLKCWIVGPLAELTSAVVEGLAVSPLLLRKSKPLSIPMGKNLENGPSVGTVGRASGKNSTIAEEFTKWSSANWKRKWFPIHRFGRPNRQVFRWGRTFDVVEAWPTEQFEKNRKKLTFGEPPLRKPKSFVFRCKKPADARR